LKVWVAPDADSKALIDAHQKAKAAESKPSRRSSRQGNPAKPVENLPRSEAAHIFRALVTMLS
jgi:hypothetical protein